MAALFYQLMRSRLDDTLAMLIDKSRERGWRVAVRGRDPARLAALDLWLWTRDAAGFLPHGLAGGPHDAAQPVLLTTGPVTNGAACLITLDGAAVAATEAATLDRVCILFDGHDDAALGIARDQWRGLTGAGIAAQYWSEDSGRWAMKTEKKPATG